MDEPGRIQVQVVNHMGQVVMSFDEGDPPTDNCHLTFDVSGLPSGLYFLHITSSNTATTDKFIKY
jgi:hypothetical protein